MMKFTLGWLKEHLDTDHSLGEIADKLTMIGLEVERIEDKAKTFAPFVIARVTEARQHPNANRLRVCMVDTGTGDPIQVVCGAPNARAGMKGVFAPPGAFIPGKNMTLGVGKIRDVESRGMLVSEFELQISNDHEGIIDLPDDAPVGASYAQWAGLDDPLIEINLTPNRADCTGVHGIARDLAAADMGKFKDAGIKTIKGEFPCPVAVKIESPELCPAFALRLVRGLKNGPSPEWLQKRLTAIGLRPINALVDITNFITFDRGRPLHVFDAAKVRGNLTVRHARAPAKHCSRSMARPTRSTKRPASLPMRMAWNRCPELWAVKKPAARKRRPTCSSSRRCGTRSISRRPAAGLASIPTPATASSAVSIRPSCCPGSSSQQKWCSISAAERRRRRWSPEAPMSPKPSSIFRCRNSSALPDLRCRCRKCGACLNISAFSSPVRASESKSRCRHGAPTSATRPMWWKRSCAFSASIGCRRRRSSAAMRRASRC